MSSTKGSDAAEKIIRQMFAGALRSAKIFDRATGGCRLSDASEHFLTAGIFEALAKCKGVTHLEVPVSACRQEAGAVRCGKPSKRDRMQGRYDLVHYWANQRPRVAIEVKNGVKVMNTALFKGDFERLTRTMTASKDSSYQFCAFVFFATADYKQAGPIPGAKKSAREKLEALTERIDDLAAEFVQSRSRPLLRRTYTSKTFYSPFPDEGAWKIGMVLFADAKAAPSFPKDLMERVG
ncbi:hypothetical protein V8246_07635 [Pseudoxanthomonas sp. F11]|uniref:hypothetical protein n=1 Tax=Pseudoxanthomonas sp. F11 TaxID=3126308 RepID=UPI00300C9CB1